MRSQTGGTVRRGLEGQDQDCAAQRQSSAESQQHRLGCSKVKVEEPKTVRAVHRALRKPKVKRRSMYNQKETKMTAGLRKKKGTEVS